nr:hypothetical protein [Tanacetum cinerariifolium]
FWYTIKKVKDSESYKFLLANKKCNVNAEVFRKILDICLRVEDEEFTKVEDDDATLTFLNDLGYKDFAFQIDHMKERKSRRETMPFPRFTKVIINHFLSQHKSLSKMQFQHYHTIKDDGVLDESIVIPATLSKATGTKLGVLNEAKVTSEAKVILEWKSQQENEYSEQDQEMTDNEKTDNKFVQDDEQVNDDDDEEMENAKVEESRKSLSVSSSFGDQFLKLSSHTSLVCTIKDDTNVEINMLLDIKIQYEVPHIQSPFVLTIHVLLIYEHVVPTSMLVTPSVVPTTSLLAPSSLSTIPLLPHQTIAPIPTPLITTDAPTITTVVPESDTLIAFQLRVAKLEYDVSKLKKTNLSVEALATLKS